MKNISPKAVLVVSAALFVVNVAVAVVSDWAWPLAAVLVGSGLFGLVLSAGSAIFARSKRGQLYIARMREKASVPDADAPAPKTLADVVRSATTARKNRNS